MGARFGGARRRPAKLWISALAWSLAVTLLWAAGGRGAPRPRPSNRAGVAKARPPAPLAAFEAEAEQMNDSADISDWAELATALREAEMSWATLKPRLRADGASAETVEAIDAALMRTAADAARRATRAAKYDTNALTLTTPSLFELYVERLPADVMRLSAGFRQLQIDAEYGDWASAAQHLATLHTVWNRIRARVVAQSRARHASVAIAPAVDSTLEKYGAALRLRHAVPAQTEAQNGRDFVEEIEQRFE